MTVTVNSSSATATASCPPNTRAIGGGGGSTGSRELLFSGPVVSSGTATGWTVRVKQDASTVTVICAP